MALSGLLFDKDGTLIDFDATWGPACYEAMRALAEGDRGRLERLMAVSHYDEAERRFRPTSPLIAGSSAHYGPLWAEALGRPATEDLFAEIDELFEFWGLESLSPIGHPAELLAGFAAEGRHLGIATNDAESSARAQAGAMGLADLVPFIAGYDSGFGPKPGPGMVLAFMRAHGLDASETALIGDTLHDMHAARAAGAVPIAVLTGPPGATAPADLAAHADHVIASVAELPDLLASLSRQ